MSASLLRPSIAPKRKDAAVQIGHGTEPFPIGIAEVDDPFVRKIVSSLVIRRADVEDWVQDAWVALIQSLPNLQLDPSRGTLLGWIRCVVFVARDAQRRANRLVTTADSHGLLKSEVAWRFENPSALGRVRKR